MRRLLASGVVSMVLLTSGFAGPSQDGRAAAAPAAQNPTQQVSAARIESLAREQSEFVRPALLRALAAYGDGPRAREAVLPLVMRGQDDFRGALIDALGDYRGGYAAQQIAEVAKLDGPLQDDAVT